MSFTYEYPRPSLTADVVLLTMKAGELSILLIQRKHAPFKGMWALPGGFVDVNEALHKAALRELEEETGVTGVTLEQIGAFGDPGRDPRGHTVSVAFLAFVMAEAKRVRAGDDAKRAQWHPIKSLALPGLRKRKNSIALAFDHARIISLAWQRLWERLAEKHRDSRLDLVPEHFTLTELQHVYEAVLGSPLESRAFRARLLEQGVVEPVAGKRAGRPRPAQLYRWSSDQRIRH